MDNEEQLLTAKQVADLKGVHLKSIYRAIQKGRLRSVGPKGVRLIRKEDAEAWAPRNPQSRHSS